jgi:hypothetical protein
MPVGKFDREPSLSALLVKPQITGTDFI